MVENQMKDSEKLKEALEAGNQEQALALLFAQRMSPEKSVQLLHRFDRVDLFECWVPHVSFVMKQALLEAALMEGALAFCQILVGLDKMILRTRPPKEIKFGSNQRNLCVEIKLIDDKQMKALSWCCEQALGEGYVVSAFEWIEEQVFNDEQMVKRVKELLDQINGSVNECEKLGALIKDHVQKESRYWPQVDSQSVWSVVNGWLEKQRSIEQKKVLSEVVEKRVHVADESQMKTKGKMGL